MVLSGCNSRGRDNSGLLSHPMLARFEMRADLVVKGGMSTLGRLSSTGYEQQPVVLNRRD